MTAQKKFKNDAFEAIHQAAFGMQKANAITKRTMREYDALCIAKVPIYNPAAIVKIRKNKVNY